MKQNRQHIDPRAAGLQVVAEQCRKNFFYFVQIFWSIIIREVPIYNWHIPYLCNELQQLSKSVVARETKPYDLIVNIPPGTSKSTIATIMFPAWLWTIDPTLRIITNSYSMDLSIEHAIKSRDIITSDKYKMLFPYVKIRRDKAAKTSYENTATGARYVTSTGGTITGKHGHIIISDDPLNPKQAASDADRKTANEHTKTLASRKVDKKNTPMIYIMQRLHEQDTTGYVLSKKAENIRHICLPAEISDDVKPVELRDNYKNGLLDAERLSKKVLKEQLIDLGSRDYAGQFQQNPVADGGNIVKKEWFQYISNEGFMRMRATEPVVFFMDTAYTSNSDNDPSGIIATCKIGENLYIIDAKKLYMQFPALIRYVPKYVALKGYTRSSTIRIEPKANGLSVIQQLREITSLNVTPTPTPKDDKPTRLSAVSAKIEGGRVILVIDAWNDEFVTEITGFPNRMHDEYVDLIAYAIDYHLKDKPVRDISNLKDLLY